MQILKISGLFTKLCFLCLLLYLEEWSTFYDCCFFLGLKNPVRTVELLSLSQAEGVWGTGIGAPSWDVMLNLVKMRTHILWCKGRIKSGGIWATPELSASASPASIYSTLYPVHTADICEGEIRAAGA